ncbi:Diacylglycerol O-acyltransferase 1 [Nymphaea thermarum]|nr:Diacylglycerol O-acyltransferase 1 [Nymphaea thermarum]
MAADAPEESETLTGDANDGGGDSTSTRLRRRRASGSESEGAVEERNMNGRWKSTAEESHAGEHGQDLSGISEKFALRAAAPAHRRIRESPLSSDAIFKQDRFLMILRCESHAGLFNLCIVVLVAVNSRLIIENIMKYGLLISSGFWFGSTYLSDWPLLMCCLTLPVFSLCAFLVEKLVQHKFISEPVVVLLHIVITTSVIMYPVFVILRFDSAVLSGIALMMCASIIWLKLVSYAHTNYDIRTLTRLKEKGEGSSFLSKLESPYHVNLGSLIYFMVAPTLCYQLSYPRTAFIRKGWVLRQLIKLVIFTGVMGFIIEQYMNPIVKNSQHPLKGNFLNALERVLKLSVPTLYVWLCMFYCFFHLCMPDSPTGELPATFASGYVLLETGWWLMLEPLDGVSKASHSMELGFYKMLRLNILAELLRFGDREFYKDWWNARTVEEYWRMWNMGVAIMIAFLLSALFHEVPLVIITSYLQHKFQNNMLGHDPRLFVYQVGNMIFWCFFSILGQPMCVLLYYHDLMNQKERSK